MSFAISFVFPSFANVTVCTLQGSYLVAGKTQHVYVVYLLLLLWLAPVKTSCSLIESHVSAAPASSLGDR